MAWCPFAVHQPLPENRTQANLDPRVAILHTAVSNAVSLFNFFNGAGQGLESHFYIYKDGTIYQYMDTARTADANLKANGFAVSIETWDGGTIVERQYTPWTQAQVDSIIKLLIWLNQVHPKIWLRRIDRWDGNGIAYHTQFGAPSPYTPVAKSCPTKARIDQYNSVILPSIARANQIQPNPILEEEEMGTAFISRDLPQTAHLTDTKQYGNTSITIPSVGTSVTAKHAWLTIRCGWGPLELRKVYFIRNGNWVIDTPGVIPNNGNYHKVIPDGTIQIGIEYKLIDKDADNRAAADVLIECVDK